MKYQLVFWPLFLLCRLVLAYFGFYLYQRTRLKGSLLLALGMLIVVIAQIFSRYLFRYLRDMFSLDTELFVINSLLLLLGYILFTVGFVKLVLSLTSQDKKPDA